jgi:NAD(P)H dehydrogenase (quinone)
MRKFLRYWFAAVTMLLAAWLPCGQTLASGSPSAAEKIVISGASGQLGDLTVKALLARGVSPDKLILVSRTPEKLAGYAQLGASVRFGDFDKPESLPAAFSGGTKMLLISISLGAKPRSELHKAAIEAAVHAGVRHIIYTSFASIEGDSPVALDHRLTEQYLKDSGVQWTILRMGAYADRLVDDAARMVASGRAYAPDDETPIAYVTRADCAAAAAGALITSGQEGKIYYVTGRELITTRKLARLVTAVTGKHIEVVPQAAGAQSESPALPTGAAPNGAPPPGSLAPPMADHGRGLRIRTRAVQELSGHPATSIRALLEANKDALLAAADQRR